ncbi:hypothetical protein ABI59_13605 [Acidobacteria bacterium Mor1]|nr:hypothetical protein ABI59_13605 [Acidobacteria bacterium Mor1]
MGMCFATVTLSDSNIQKVLDDPPLIWRAIAPDDPDAYEEARGSSRSLWARLTGRGKSAPAADLQLSENEGLEWDLDKAWHGIHYLLTGTDWGGTGAAAFIINGGQQVGDIDVGYGPARVFTAAEVRGIRDALHAVDDQTLRDRFNPTEMMALEIYPTIWDRDPTDDDTLGWLLETIQPLRGHLDETVQNGLGLVVFVT